MFTHRSNGGWALSFFPYHEESVKGLKIKVVMIMHFLEQIYFHFAIYNIVFLLSVRIKPFSRDAIYCDWCKLNMRRPFTEHIELNNLKTSVGR